MCLYILTKGGGAGDGSSECLLSIPAAVGALGAPGSPNKLQDSVYQLSIDSCLLCFSHELIKVVVSYNSWHSIIFVSAGIFGLNYCN